MNQTERIKTKLSAINMTVWTIFDHLCLVPRPRQFALLVTMPSAPTPPPISLQLFLDCLVFTFTNLIHNLHVQQHIVNLFYLLAGYRDSARLLGESF